MVIRSCDSWVNNSDPISGVGGRGGGMVERMQIYSGEFSVGGEGSPGRQSLS